MRVSQTAFNSDTLEQIDIAKLLINKYSNVSNASADDRKEQTS